MQGLLSAKRTAELQGDLTVHLSVNQCVLADLPASSNNRGQTATDCLQLLDSIDVYKGGPVE